MTPTPQNDSILLEVLDSEVQLEVLRDHLGAAMATFVASTEDRVYKRARVVAVGPGRRHPKTDRRMPMMVAPGDLVIYRDWLVRWHSGDSIWPGPGDLAMVQQETRDPQTGRVLQGDDQYAIVCILEDESATVQFPREHGEALALPESYFDADAVGARASGGGGVAL